MSSSKKSTWSALSYWRENGLRGSIAQTPSGSSKREPELKNINNDRLQLTRNSARVYACVNITTISDMVNELDLQYFSTHHSKNKGNQGLRKS